MTETLTLRRFLSEPDGIVGQLMLDGRQLCLTLELPWDGNLPGRSDIPAGTYQVVPHDSPAHPHTWEVAGVPGRSGILIHNGNTEADSRGCILVGSSYGKLDGRTAVLNSVQTLDMLRETLPARFLLTIE